jgi:hypothetical protein
MYPNYAVSGVITPRREIWVGMGLFKVILGTVVPLAFDPSII